MAVQGDGRGGGEPAREQADQRRISCLPLSPLSPAPSLPPSFPPPAALRLSVSLTIAPLAPTRSLAPALPYSLTRGGHVEGRGCGGARGQFRVGRVEERVGESGRGERAAVPGATGRRPTALSACGRGKGPHWGEVDRAGRECGGLGPGRSERR